MKRPLVIAALVGAAWMTLVIVEGWYRLAMRTNYPGMLFARFVRYRGIAPSATIVSLFNVWLVLTSALQWAVIASLICGTWNHFRRHRTT